MSKIDTLNMSLIYDDMTFEVLPVVKPKPTVKHRKSLYNLIIVKELA